MAKKIINSKEENFDENSNIVDQSIEQIMHDSMMPYSEYVILDRALPRVEDGLKPVHRRILYSMYEMGLTPDKPHRKSAAIVGDCLGKYHPHGDSSVYDALVRMAQPFNMSMTLVDGHGNFGSIDGDSAAAMRYTEARLTALAGELLKNIEKNTVNWTNNYDDRLKEPETLPCRYPNILVNGASGIAVGMSTEIPPHNIGEIIDGTIALIDNKNMTLDELMTFIKGPDLPTGAKIINMANIKEAYATGRGKMIMRAKLTVENADNDKRNIIIKEIPYQVNKSQLLLKIAMLKEDKKYPVLSGILDVVDESDRTGMRAVIKLKRDADINEILRILHKDTNLQSTIGINMVAIANGKPKQMPLMEILNYYIEYQRNVIVRRSKYDLEIALNRKEIIEGLLIAIRNIDEVIAIIKASKSITEAKLNLRKRFPLSEKQANAIMEMRVSRLVGLEIEKLEIELKELNELIIKLKTLIANKRLQYEQLKKELKEIKKTYRQHRRTELLENDDGFGLQEDTCEARMARLCLMESAKTLKLVATRAYETAINGTCGNLYDLVKKSLEFTTDKKILAFTNYGNACTLYFKNAELKKWNFKGDKLNTIFNQADEDEKVVEIMEYPEDINSEIYLYTKMGLIKKTSFDQILTRSDYSQALTINKDDELIGVERVDSNSNIYFITSKGIGLNIKTDTIPYQKKASGGVKCIKLKDDDYVEAVMQINDDGYILALTDYGYAKKLVISIMTPVERYSVGSSIYQLKGKYGTRIVAGGFIQAPVNVAFMYNENEYVTINSEKIPVKNEVACGERLTDTSETNIQLAVILK